jgi:hypothetical protein
LPKEVQHKGFRYSFGYGMIAGLSKNPRDQNMVIVEFAEKKRVTFTKDYFCRYFEIILVPTQQPSSS